MINVGTKHTTEHYKMYKSGKQWVTAMLATATLTTVAVTTNQISAHADSTGNSISESAETTSGGNAVAQTSANANNSSNSAVTNGVNSQTTSNGGQNNSIPVNVDHSALNQAVQNAKNAGMEVTQDPTENTTVSQNEVENKKQEIASNEQQQVNDINNKIALNKQEDDNVNKFNGGKGDTTALDNAVSDAKNTPGLNVIKDDDVVSNFKASDNSGIENWQDSTKQDYSNQTEAIKNAIATQKQALDAWKSHNGYGQNTITSDQVTQMLHLESEPNAQLSVSTPYTWTGLTQSSEWAGGKFGVIQSPESYDGGILGTATYTNFQHSYYVDANGQKHMISKEVVTFSNSHTDGSMSQKMSNNINLAQNPINFIVYGSFSVDCDFKFYDENGQLINFANTSAWVSPMSLNANNVPDYYDDDNNGTLTHAGMLREACEVLEGGTPYQLAGSSITLHNGNDFYSDHDNSITQNGSKYSIEQWDGVPDHEYYGAGLIRLTGDHLKLRFHEAFTDDQAATGSLVRGTQGDKHNGHLQLSAIPDHSLNSAWAQMSTVIPQTPTPRTEVHYHYDVSRVTKSPADAPKVNYHLTDLNVTINPTKQWTENGQNSNNKVYFDGDTAHATVSATLNSINDYDGIKDGFSISDDYSQLAKDATVTGATVTENGQDVTDQYNLSVHNGVVTMTRKNTNNMQDGTYVLNVTFKLNDDVAKGTQLTNQGFLTVGSHQLDVTPVTITTTTPDPHKDVAAGEINGTSENSINGQTVANGTVSTFPFTTNDLDANRAKNITDRAYEDTLDSRLTYKGFKAYIKNAQGQLEDVTSHIHATQNGQTITFTEDSYLIDRYNQDLTQAVTTPIIDVYAQVNGDNVQIKNQYTLIQNGIKYTSNEVGIHTPEAPKPIKKDYNEDNVDIDGKTVLPGSTNKYEITADYDQYKGIQTSEDNIGKGFYIIDDYPEEALDADPNKFSAIDSTGKSVNDLNYKVYQSVSDAPQGVQEAIQQQGIKINGAFIVASANNPSEYFAKYVQTGDSITVIMPMTVKDAYTGSYTNSAYEFDFGHGYATNIVTNNVPKITPTKDAVDEAGNPIKDNGNVPLNEVFKYDLHGAVLPGGEGHDLTQYGFTDDYDESHDEYQNTYKVVLTTDVTLKDGTVLKKGTDVTQYTTQSYDLSKGALDIEFSPDFLKTVDMSKTTGFGADALLVFKRIASGEVTNQYTNWINGKPYLSNVFKTHTPKPDTPKPSPEPEKPSPKANTPAPVIAAVTPAQPKAHPAKQTKDLPQTGNSKSGLASLGFVGLLIALGSLGIGRKRKSA